LLGDGGGRGTLETGAVGGVRAGADAGTGAEFNCESNAATELEPGMPLPPDADATGVGGGCCSGGVLTRLCHACDARRRSSRALTPAGSWLGSVSTTNFKAGAGHIDVGEAHGDPMVVLRDVSISLWARLSTRVGRDVLFRNHIIYDTVSKQVARGTRPCAQR
jgi:hypothetical protein